MIATQQRSVCLAAILLFSIMGLIAVQKNAISQDVSERQYAQRCSRKRVQTCLPGGCLEPPRSAFSLIILSPPRGAVGKLKPSFAWLPVEGENRYRVSLKRSGRLLWQMSVIGTELVYPEGENPLEWGKDYDLIIESEHQGGAIGKVRFRTLEPEELQEIEMEIQGIENRELSPEETTLAIVELYEKFDLIGGAIALLQEAIENTPQSTALYLKLGQLYLEQVQSPQLAQSAYQQALTVEKEVQETNDLIVQAEAQIGLAKAIFATEGEDWERGIVYLKNAYDNYILVENRAFEAAQVAQFLGEIYRSQEEMNSASQWYQIALERYQDLGEQEYIDRMEDVLEALRQ